MDRLLRHGNSKLGIGIFKTSLPPVQTCPGRGQCEKFCYAVKIARIYQNVGAMYQRHYDRYMENPTQWESDMNSDLNEANPRYVRIHESGDFFSIPYIQTWERIIKANPQTEFLAYTRSWTVPELLPALEKLRILKNVRLRASLEDNETAPATWGYNVVITKAQSEEAAKQLRGTVCPEQTGKMDSCSKCLLCYKTDLTVVFQKH